VGVGNIENWSFDPYEGFEDEEYVGGRGQVTKEVVWHQWFMLGKYLRI